MSSKVEVIVEGYGGINLTAYFSLGELNNRTVSGLAHSIIGRNWEGEDEKTAEILRKLTYWDCPHAFSVALGFDRSSKFKLVGLEEMAEGYIVSGAGGAKRLYIDILNSGESCD